MMKGSITIVDIYEIRENRLIKDEESWRNWQINRDYTGDYQDCRSCKPLDQGVLDNGEVEEQYLMS